MPQKPLRFTLLADGTSDRALLYPLQWLLGQWTDRVLLPKFAELGRLRSPPKTLGERIATAGELYPADVLFIHRDAERVAHAQRLEEIDRAIATREHGRYIPVVPVRMLEAWLLFDEPAIRMAAGNPAGRVDLDLPPLERLERVADPKIVLHDVLQIASELGARRRRRLRAGAHQVAELIEDFGPLRRLPAFADLERCVAKVCRDQGWAPTPT